jgi:putative transposase
MGANERQVLDCRRRQFVRIEQILDIANKDNCYLKIPAVAQAVFESLDWLERELDWVVFAATIMPNHVHCVLQHFKGRNGKLNEDLGRIKSYTAHLANKVLGRAGRFWQDENFDHWIRSAEKFDAALEYVKCNPVKAGLACRWEDWPWTRVAGLSPADVMRMTDSIRRAR